MHLDYTEQLEIKRQRVQDAMTRIGRLPEIVVEPCLKSPGEFHYRNKIQVPIVPDEEGMKIGFYAKKSHDVIDVEECLIHCDLGDKIYRDLRALLLKSDIAPYNETSGKGLLRHILIRTAVHSGEVLVTFVTNGPESEKLTQIANHLIQNQPEVKAVVQNINTRRQNVILGKEWRNLAGEDHIQENICELQFNVSPASFFQVNPMQAENLYRKVIELADIGSTTTALDGYCGVGTLSLLMAKEASKVYGIECIPEAIHDAIANAKRNGITNTQFICGTVESRIGKLDHLDVVVLNPPRKGCERKVLDHILKAKPKRLVYVSCDPATLARDLAILHEGGYRVDVVQPFDMFPQTSHVETVVRCTYE